MFLHHFADLPPSICLKKHFTSRAEILQSKSSQQLELTLAVTVTHGYCFYQQVQELS